MSKLRFKISCLLPSNTGLLIGFVLAVIFWNYLPSGVYLGGDWTSPATLNQAHQLFPLYVWSSSANMGQPALLSALGFLYGVFMHFLFKLGFPLEYFGKTLITTLIVFTYCSFYLFLKYLRLKESASVLGAIIYIFSPVFFNYSLMGWPFALMAMGLFPLAAKWFCQTVAFNNASYAILVAFVWAIAALQSQSLVWFPLLFMGLGISVVYNWKDCKIYLKYLALVLIVFLGLCAYWWVALILFKDDNITSSAIITSGCSVGADAHFTPLNALRTFGGLYNFQFESAMVGYWGFASWFLPIFAISALLIVEKEKRRLAISMGFISFVFPVVFLLLENSREILVSLPGAGLIRQISRFTVLTSFGYAALVGIAFDAIVSAKKYLSELLLLSVVVMLSLSVSPWWRGELTNSTGAVGADFRLRVKKFPGDYYAAEKYLQETRFITHALYLPYGMSADYKDDPSFHGMFKEAVDVFAAFSPVPGELIINDRPSSISDYIKFIHQHPDIIAATSLTPINLYVLRKNMEPGSLGPMFRKIDKFFPVERFNRIWNSKNISIYSRKSPIPIIYSPQTTYLEHRPLDSLTALANSSFAYNGGVVVLPTQNIPKLRAVKSVSGEASIQRAIEYSEISPVKYRIIFHGVKGLVPLLFGESYSRGWKMYPVSFKPPPKTHHALSINPNDPYRVNSIELEKYIGQGWISYAGSQFISKRYLGAIQNDNLPIGNIAETWRSAPLSESQHIKVNGYANEWVVNVNQLCLDTRICRYNANGSFDIEFVMEFWPQQAFYLGLALSIATFFASILFLLWRLLVKLRG